MTNINSASAHLCNVKVSSSARLHLGFLDLNGNIGRKFGSYGLAIDSFATTVIAKKSPSLSIRAPQPHQVEKAEIIIQRFNEEFADSINTSQQYEIEFSECIPEHSGLGSGTQFTLSLIAALAQLHQIPLSPSQIAAKFNRGKRSGIGIGTFEQGGFVVDGGNAPDNTVPPILARHPFPEQWRIVLIFDPQHQGIHGTQEVNAFKTLPVFPESSAQKICHITLMQLLPALIEKNILQFSQAITNVQAMIGDHFAPAQGGRYTSSNVEALLIHAKSLGFEGIAQSSWGPTGCIFAESDSQAQQLVNDLKRFANKTLPKPVALELKIAKANNSGAILTTSNV